MPGYKQANRLMQFTSPYGQDVLLIEHMEGVEGVSRLFDFQVEVLADAGSDLNPTTIVGSKATVELALLDVKGTRYFNGLVASFEQTRGDDNFDVYRAHIVPSLWQLTLATNCRVFQNQTVMDIIKAVIAPYSLSVGDVTTTAYKPLDYCTQYNETDFNFISRLAEQFGIFYWFEHSASDHKVVFGDSRSAYSACPSVSQVQYSPQSMDNERNYHSLISDVRVTSTMLTGKHSSRDYDFRGYSSTQNGPDSSTQPFGENALERYHFVSGESAYVKMTDKQVSTPNHGATIILAQADASDANGNVFHGTSTARSFVPGFTFSQTQHPRSSWNQSYFLTEVTHQVEQVPSYLADKAPELSTPYVNHFTAIESTQLHRTEKRTPKPLAHGPQTAKVVVGEGEDLHLDKYGRVCVEFFWNRAATGAPDNTWVRVAQPWAGSGWGTYIWPRVGDEVIIHFLHGDPDEPVCVGSVYNGTNMPKYALPDMGTRTGIVTRSSTGGSSSTFNELRFEDKMGKEQIFMQAQFDMDHRVKNDMRTYVMGQDSLLVDKDQLEKIGGNYNRQITGNSVEAITGTQDEHVTGDATFLFDGASNSHIKGDSVKTIDGKTDLTMTGDVTVSYGGASSTKISGDSSSSVDGKQGLKVTGAVSHKYSDKYSLAITADHAETNANYAMASDQTVYIKGGMSVVIEAGMELTIKAAGGFINIGPAGVAISGTMVMINSGGAAGSGQAPSPDSPDDPKTPATPKDPAKPKDPDTADDSTKGTKM